jgi:hypothetical protein
LHFLDISQCPQITYKQEQELRDALLGCLIIKNSTW